MELLWEFQGNDLKLWFYGRHFQTVLWFLNLFTNNNYEHYPALYVPNSIPMKTNVWKLNINWDIVINYGYTDKQALSVIW